MKFSIKDKVSEPITKNTYKLTINYMYGDADLYDNESFFIPNEELLSKVVGYVKWFVDHQDDYGYEEVPEYDNLLENNLLTAFDPDLFIKDENYNIVNLNYDYIKKEYNTSKEDIDPVFKTKDFFNIANDLDCGNTLNCGSYVEGLGIGSPIEYKLTYFDNDGVEYNVEVVDE